MKKGVLICFIGIDGSGKSTQAEALSQILAARGIDNVCVWTRFEPHLSKPVVNIIRKLFFHKKDAVSDYGGWAGTKKKLGRNRILLHAYIHLLGLDYSHYIHTKIGRPLRRKQVVVCDRYIHDTISDLSVDFDLSPEQVGKMLKAYLSRLPKPALVFLLDLPEDIAYQRKTDVPSLAYLSERRGIYQQMCQDYDMIRLDGTKPVSLLTEEISRQTLDYLQSELK